MNSSFESSTSQVRTRLQRAITCEHCGHRTMTYADVAKKISLFAPAAPLPRGHRITADLVSDFLAGKDIRTSQLDLIEEAVEAIAKEQGNA